MSKTQQEKIADLIGYTNATMEKVAAEKEAAAQLQAKVDALIPSVVAALVANERIEPHQQKLAAESLRDPLKALEIMIKVASHRNDAEVGLGQPVPSTKVASAGTDAPTGGSTLRPSDQKLFSGLGLRVPLS
jgi:hypothetical protein